MSRRIWSLALLLPFAPVIGCGPSQAKKEEAPPPKVDVALPVTKDVTDYEEFTGRTDAKESINIQARVTGYLTQINFKEGDDVKKDDFLFEIDPRPYQAQLDQAQAQVNLNQASVKLAQANYERNLPLVSKGAISPQELDQYKATLDEAIARVKASQASLEIYKLNVEFTRINSPIDGRISRQFINKGNLVKADDTVLTNIVTLDPIYVSFDVDERTMLRIRRLIREGKIKSAREKGVTAKVEMGTSDEDGFPHEGVINFIDNKLDPGTGTLRLRAEIPNPQGRTPGSFFLAPGLFARLRIPIGDRHPATLVAERALNTDQGQKFLYVVNDDNVVDYRPVKVGVLHGGLRAIEASDKPDEGVKPGERVVVTGLQRVRKGTKVDPTLVDMEKLPGGNKTAVVTNQHSAVRSP